MQFERQKCEINLNPIQRGGILTEAAKKALVEFGDGYSVCDFCAGRLDLIEKPNIKSFIYDELPTFLGCDIARTTHGAREAIFTVIHSLGKNDECLLADGNAHYSTYISAERAGLKVKIVESSGYPGYKVNVDDFEAKIDSEKPVIVILTYPDGSYGNFPDAKKLAKICKKKNVPLLLNGAYSVGRCEINMNELGADFIVGSGHKSMASAGPIGVLGFKKEWEETLLKKSEFFERKEIELLGCTSRGVPIMTLMASFPEVKERIKKWDEEVKKARYFSKELEKLGINQLGEKPHNHDLMFFEAPILYTISQNQKKKGFFLYHELKERGICGIRAGLTKNFKISTYQLKKDEIEKVLEAFRDIIKKNSSQ